MNKPAIRAGSNRMSRRGFRGCKQGYYICKNVEKYVGDPNNIIYRSGLELSMFKFSDLNPNILKWGSEIVTIPYLDQASGKQRTYYIDLYIEYIDKNGKLLKSIVEIKPYSETLPPNNRGKNFDKRLSEYMTNTSKWKAANAYAKMHDMEFKILTEKDIR